MGPGPRLPARHHLCGHPARGGCGTDRDLGSSYSGGHVLVGADFIAGLRGQFEADRLARFNGELPVMVPVVDEDPLAPSALPTADSWQWFTETGKTHAPAWRYEVSLRSVEMFTEYEPVT